MWRRRQTEVVPRWMDGIERRRCKRERRRLEKMQSPFAISKKLIFKRLSFSVFIAIHHFLGDLNQPKSIKKRFDASGHSGIWGWKRFFFFSCGRSCFRSLSDYVPDFLFHNWLPFLNDYREKAHGRLKESGRPKKHMKHHSSMHKIFTSVSMQKLPKREKTFEWT